jgi:hypothetical protein
MGLQKKGSCSFSGEVVEVPSMIQYALLFHLPKKKKVALCTYIRGSARNYLWNRNDETVELCRSQIDIY